MTEKTDTPAAPAAEDKPVVIAFADPSKRAKTVDLAFPVTVNGKTMDKIVIRRMTQAEIAAFIEQNAGKEGVTRFPLFYDADGNKIPDEVHSALDDDDALALEQAASDFLPRRFRPAS